MKTLQEIRDELEDIQTSMNITSPSVEIQRELLARSIYENEVNNVSEVLNSSISRATNLNSTITHAMDRCYSVYRGKNQRIFVSDVVAVSNKNVSRFDVAAEVSGYKLLYAKDYEFVSGSQPDEPIELILCDEIKTKSYTITTQNTIKIDVTVEDVSEDVYVTTNNSGEYTVHEITSDLAEAMDDGKLLVLTNTDFGLRLVNYNLWNYESTVIVKYVEFISDTIDANQLTVLSGFTPLTSEDEITVTTKDPISRMEDKNLICAYANRYWLSNGIIKSNYDIDEIVKSTLVSQPYMCYDAIMQHTMEKVEGSDDKYTYEMTVYYTRDNPLSTDEETAITNKLALSYYIPSEIKFKQAVTSSNSVVKPRKDSDIWHFIINVYYEQTIPSQGVYDIVQERQYNITDRTLNMYEFLAKIQALDGVVYAELTADFIDTATDEQMEQDASDGYINIQQMIFTLNDLSDRFDLSTVEFNYVLSS